MPKSKAKQGVVLAYDRGYRVTEDGMPIRPDGTPMTFYLSRRHHGGPRYKILSIMGDNKYDIRKFGVHQLQAYQLYGSKWYDHDVVVRHKNGDALDNSKENILIGSHSDNSMDRPESMRLSTARTAALVRRKLDASQVAEIRTKREYGASYRSLMEEYSLAKSTISYIVNRKTYTQVDASGCE